MKGIDASRYDWQLEEPDPDDFVCDACGEPGGGNCAKCEPTLPECDD